MPARPLSINLLAQDEFASSLVGKFLLWALSIGRYIVVFTELIVILSFLSRFSLDRQLTDVNEEIVRQKAIIQSYGDLENRIRRIQQQVSLVNKVDESLYSPDLMSMLSGVTPTDVRLTELTVSENTVLITGQALTSNGFIRMLLGLMNSSLVESVSVDSVASKENDLTIDFEMTVTVKNSLLLES